MTSFNLSRLQSNQLQFDISPPAPSSEPALAAGEFFLGKTSPLNLVDLSTGAVSADPSPAPTPVAAPPAPALASAPAPMSKLVEPPTPGSVPIPRARASVFVAPSSLPRGEGVKMTAPSNEVRSCSHHSGS
ncbi:hypothetical protein FRC07_007519 [Ceratobasidium sp. 392]|nr:hypothetical protein FRC07_007519 [Ceratobasidium sp. 392]